MYIALRGKGGSVEGFECLKLVFRANGLDIRDLGRGTEGPWVRPFGVGQVDIRNSEQYRSKRYGTRVGTRDTSTLVVIHVCTLLKTLTTLI